jgi:hypothetical protein
MVRDASNHGRGAKRWPHGLMVLKSLCTQSNAMVEQVTPAAETVTIPEPHTMAKPTLHAHLARPLRKG